MAAASFGRLYEFSTRYLIHYLDTHLQFHLLWILWCLNYVQTFVVTDQFHIKRSLIIANTIYFSTGIDIVPCPYMGGDLQRVESDSLIWGDFARSLIWKLTGYLFYDPSVKNERIPQIKADQKLVEELL